MLGLDSSTVLNFISYTPDVPTPTPTPTPDPTVVGLLTPQTGDIATLLIVLFGILATVSVALVLGRNISHNVKSVFAAFCASMLPLVLAGSCVVGINSMAVAENSTNSVNPQIDVYVNTEGGPVHYGEGATSNVQKFTNDTEDEVTISEVQFKIVDQASDVFVGQWTGKLNEDTLLFSGGAGDTYKLENPIALDAGESFEVTWTTDTQSEDLFDCIGKAPVSICYVAVSTKHTVTFNSNGGSEVASQEVSHGQTVDKPSEPTKDNNEFVWWASDEKLSIQFDFNTPVTEDLTLYAKWEVTEEYVEEVEEKATEEADKAKKEVEEELKELLTEEELELVKDSMDDLLDEFKKALVDAKTSEEVEQAKKKFEEDLLDIEKEALKGGSEKQEKEAEEDLDDISGLSEGDIERYKKKLQSKKHEIDKKIEDSQDFENAKKEQEKFDSAAEELLNEAIELGKNKDEAREANEDISQDTEDKIETFSSLLPETIQKYKKKVQDLKKTTDENIDEAESSEDVEDITKMQKENIDKILQEIQTIVLAKEEVQAATEKELKEKQDQIGNLPDLNPDVKAQYVENLKQKEAEFQTKLKQTDDLDEINKVFKELEDSFNSIFADAKDFSDKIVNSKEDLNNLALNEMEKIEDNPDINSFDEAYLIKQIDDLNKKGTADIPNSKSKEEVEKKLAKYKADINNISSNLVTIRLVVTGGEGHFEDLHNENVPITTKTDVKDASCGLGIYVGQGMRLVSVVDSTQKTYTVGNDGSFEAQLTSAFTITATVEETQDEAYAYLNDTKDTLTFTYDNEKDSHEFAWNCENTQDYPPWDKYVGHGSVAESSVMYVTFTDAFNSNASSVNNCKNWFFGYGTETSAANSNIVQFNNMSNCDFSNVASMDGMFAYCNNIESHLDLSKWETSTKLTSTANMFSGCTKMTTAPNLSGFNTAGLKRIDHMFFGCESMATIPNIVDWDVSTVEDFSILFYGCTSLNGLLDLSKWNPVSATSFDGAFHGCIGLTDINISSFDFSIKKPDTGSSYGMFNNCYNLKHIFYNRDASGIWTSQQSKWMFFNCAKLPHWDTDSSKTDKTYAYPNNGEHGFFTDPHPTVTLKPFEGGHYEDVANARIDQISGDWNSTDTQVKVVIDDQSLIIDSIIDNGGNHYELTGDNCFLVDFSARYTITVTTRLAYEAYAALVSSSENSPNDTLLFNYDDKKDTYQNAWNCENTRGELPGWTSYVGGGYEFESTVTSVVFSDEFKQEGSKHVEYCDNWFFAYDDNSIITSFDINNCNFSSLVNCVSMFDGCVRVENIDISGWTTGPSLNSITYMFRRCKSLISGPNLSSLDVTNLQNMSNIFEDCEAMTTPPVISGGKWDDKVIRGAKGLFKGCKNLTEVNINSIIFKSYSTLEDMFNGCSNLTKIYCNRDWSNLSKIDSKNMFAGCSALTNIATDTVYDCTYAYPDDGQGHGHFTELPKEAYATITTANAENDTLELHYDSQKSSCSIVFDDILNMSEPKWKEYTYGTIKSVKNVVVKPEFNQVAPTKMNSWFKSQWNINSISGLANINTSNVTNMSSLFYEYNGTNTIDGISNWDTSSVTNMTYMFYDAKFTTTPSISGWNVSNVEEFDCLFSRCSSLASPIDLSAWILKKDSSKRVSFFNAFSECTYVPFINVGFTIDGTKLYTGYMFSGCSSCTNIYCNKDWRSLLDGSNEDMFARCSSLKHWDTDSGRTDGFYAYPDDGQHGFFTSFPLAAKAVYTTSDQTLTFYYDWKSHEGEGDVIEVIKDYSGSTTPFSAAKYATSVRFDSSFKNFKGITSLKYWFYNFNSLENVYNFENVDTSEVTTMFATFYWTAIKNIDFSNNNLSSLSSDSEGGIGKLFFCDKSLESVIFPESINSSASCACSFVSCEHLAYVDMKGIIFVDGRWFGTSPFQGCNALRTIKTSADKFDSDRPLSTLLNEIDTTSYSTWHSELAGADFASNTITGTKGSTGMLDTFTKVDSVDHGRPPISVLDILLDFFSVIFDIVV